MNTNIQTMIDNYDAKCQKADIEREKAEEYFLEKFVSLIDEVKPVADFMISKGIKFTHPDLDKEICSTKGAIIGYNENSELYIYIDAHVYSYHTATQETKYYKSIDEFLIKHPKDFAYEGIVSLRDILQQRINDYQEDTDKILALCDKIEYDKKIASATTV